MSRGIFKKCEIHRIYKRIDVTFTHEYVIEVRYVKEGKFMGSFHSVPFDKGDTPKLVKELKELKKEKRQRIYLAFGMQDIDIMKNGKDYAIMHSPNEALYYHFFLKTGEIDKIISTFERIEVAEPT